MSAEKKSKWSEGWVKRRVLYAVLGVVGAVAAGFGLVTAEQLQSFEDYLPTIITAITALGASGTAIANTHRGSDSTATGDDVRAAQAAQPYIPEMPNLDPAQIAADAAEKFADMVDGSLGTSLRHSEKPVVDGPVGGTYPGGE